MQERAAGTAAKPEKGGIATIQSRCNIKKRSRRDHCLPWTRLAKLKLSVGFRYICRLRMQKLILGSLILSLAKLSLASFGAARLATPRHLARKGGVGGGRRPQLPVEGIP